jgi:hypothetical protein
MVGPERAQPDPRHDGPGIKLPLRDVRWVDSALRYLRGGIHGAPSPKTKNWRSKVIVNYNQRRIRERLACVNFHFLAQEKIVTGYVVI